MRKKGYVKFYDKKKGYGIIKSYDGEEYFFHHSSGADLEKSDIIKEISIVFDPSSSSKEDVLNILLRLSDLYRAIAGEGLIIDGGSIFSPKDVQITV